MLRWGLIFFISGFVFNIIETWYFGWNWTAKSVPEWYCDAISALLMFAGMLPLYRSFFRWLLVKPSFENWERIMLRRSPSFKYLDQRMRRDLYRHL